MSWADLFERAEAFETDVETIRETLAARREAQAVDREAATEENREDSENA